MKGTEHTTETDSVYVNVYKNINAVLPEWIAVFGRENVKVLHRLTDYLMSLLFGKLILDICNVEDWFYTLGMSEDESMADFVLRAYGERGYKLITRLLML